MPHQPLDSSSIAVQNARLEMEAFYNPTEKIDQNINRKNFRKEMLGTLQSLLLRLVVERCTLSRLIKTMELSLAQSFDSAARLEGRRRVETKNLLTADQGKINRLIFRRERRAEDEKMVRGWVVLLQIRDHPGVVVE